MSIFSGLISYQDIDVNGLWKSQFFSASSITSTTFYGGSISSLYVGSGFTTNQEYKYVSGLTSDTQTQINSKRAKSEPFITSGTSADLTNYRQISSNGITLSATNNNLIVSAPIRDLIISNITVTSTNTYEYNFSPSGWSDSVKLKSSVIILSQVGQTSIISGLIGGSSGRVVIIRNALISSQSSSFYIFEHNSTKTISNNKFCFSDGEAYFLMPNSNLTLIYDGVSGCWRNMYPIQIRDKYDRYNDFYNLKTNLAYSNMRRNISDFPHQVGSNQYVKVSQYLDSPHVLLLGTNNNTTLVQIRPSRNESNLNAFIIGKISINSSASVSTRYNNTNQFFFFGLSAGVNTKTSDTFSYTALSCAWSVPYNYSFPNVWNIFNAGLATPLTSSTVSLSSCVGQWIYLGIYTSDNGVSYVYSYDNKEFYFEKKFTLSNANPKSAPNITARFSSTTESEEFYLDSVGLMFGR